jgi:uncharacterized protein with NRDE domain
MCLILFAHKAHPDYPLVIAANRDEAYARPTAPAAFWEDNPRLYGGRDLAQGGTWLGINRTGAIAALTNYRDRGATKNSSHSRGELVADYLRGHEHPVDYIENVRRDANAYNGFNLLAGNIDELRYLSNRGGDPSRVAPGVHGLSNHLLDTPWPKVERGRRIVTELLQSPSQALIDSLFGVLAERIVAPDDALPKTGVGLARERVLSPAFIVSPAYGTRSSTVVLVDNHGEVVFIERSFGERGAHEHTTTGRFALESAPTPAAV